MSVSIPAFKRQLADANCSDNDRNVADLLTRALPPVNPEVSSSWLCDSAGVAVAVARTATRAAPKSDFLLSLKGVEFFVFDLLFNILLILIRVSIRTTYYDMFGGASRWTAPNGFGT